MASWWKPVVLLATDGLWKPADGWLDYRKIPFQNIFVHNAKYRLDIVFKMSRDCVKCIIFYFHDGSWGRSWTRSKMRTRSMIMKMRMFLGSGLWWRRFLNLREVILKFEEQYLNSTVQWKMWFFYIEGKPFLKRSKERQSPRPLVPR